jgi:aldehyde dehydrogenase (NAD+)
MAQSVYSQLVADQRAYFQTGVTKEFAWRDAQLKALSKMLVERASEFYEALWKDLHRNQVDAELLDVGYVEREVTYSRKCLRSWMSPKKVSTPLALMPANAMVRQDPLGVCLIIGAWNYPVMLTLAPLCAAIAGGNTAIIKPSEMASATAELIAKVLPLYLDNKAFAVVCGGAVESAELLEEHFDHIFYTGNGSVGRRVMTAAAHHLTPVVLELGGKNPCVVHSSANLKVAARRIAQGRYTNAGQTCTAPDYVLVFKEVKEAFLEYLKEAIIQFYGQTPELSPDYGRIVNEYHFDRLMALMNSGRAYHGGSSDRASLFLAPTILVDVDQDSLAMHEEVFGPILPVLEVNSVDECLEQIARAPHPLSVYVFAEDKKVVQEVVEKTQSGSVAINDCTLEPLVRNLPFGGVGHSGMGKYHGEWGFQAYTNARGVLCRSTAVDIQVRYPPYSKRRWLRKLMKGFL